MGAGEQRAPTTMPATSYYLWVWRRTNMVGDERRRVRNGVARNRYGAQARVDGRLLEQCGRVATISDDA